MTFETYARALCTKMGWSQSLNNIDVIVAWEAAEGSQAQFNPLDTEEGGQPGESDYNSVGVKNYPTLDEGLQAVYDTLTNGLYANVLNCFARSEVAQTTTAAIDQCPWGTRNVTEVLTLVQAQRTDYYTRPIYPLEVPSSTPPPEATTPPPEATTPPPEATTPPAVDPVAVAPAVDPAPAAATEPVAPTWNDAVFSVANEGVVLPAVKAIQACLVDVWGYTIAIDGSYGPITEGAVKSFQRSRQIPVDGIVGPVTRPLLLGL